jgi:hypothetical protein
MESSCDCIFDGIADHWNRCLDLDFGPPSLDEGIGSGRACHDHCAGNFGRIDRAVFSTADGFVGSRRSCADILLYRVRDRAFHQPVVGGTDIPVCSRFRSCQFSSSTRN